MSGLSAVFEKLQKANLADELEDRLSIRPVEAADCKDVVLQFVRTQPKGLAKKIVCY